MCFTGFDAYKKVIDACDVVLLTTPPHFRPMHLKAAVEAGKHVFAEKPVAVDAPGVRSVIETAKKAKEKNLSAAGRLLLPLRVRQAGDGQAHPRRGDRRRDGHPLQLHHQRAGGTTPIEGADRTRWSTRCKNWYYFTWLSGDHIVEQHCHNHDKAAWVLKGEYPVSCYGMGGRQ